MDSFIPEAVWDFSNRFFSQVKLTRNHGFDLSVNMNMNAVAIADPFLEFALTF